LALHPSPAVFALRLRMCLERGLDLGVGNVLLAARQMPISAII
jgi:hypothetical protein